MLPGFSIMRLKMGEEPHNSFDKHDDSENKNKPNVLLRLCDFEGH